MSLLAWLLLLSTITGIVWFIVKLAIYLSIPESEHIQREHEARIKHYLTKQKEL